MTLTAPARPTRRRILTALASTPLLAACAGPGQSAAPADTRLALTKGPVTVVPFIYGGGGGEADSMRASWDTQIVAAYRERRPNVTVDLIPQTGTAVERVEKMTALKAGGAALDLGDGPLGVRAMVAQNLLDPALDALIKRDRYDLKRFNQAHLTAAAGLDGKLWALPFRYGGNAMCLACNVALFREAGVALPPQDAARPWTWDEFASALTRLTKRAGSDVGRFGLASHAWAIGTWPPLWQTDWISADLKTITCDTKEMQECYTRLGELFTRHRVVPQPGEAARLFGPANVFNTGKAAILLFPPSNWLVYGAGAQVDYTFAPMPKAPQSVPDMAATSISLYHGSKVTGDAWDFLQFLIERSRLARLINVMTPVVADIESWVREQLKNVPSADARALLGIVERAGQGSSKLLQHTRYADMAGVMTPLLDQFMAGALPPAQMLQTLKPQLQQIIDAR